MSVYVAVVVASAELHYLFSGEVSDAGPLATDARVFFPALCVGAVWFLTQCRLSHHTSPHLAYHVLADIGPANGCNSSGVPRASVGPANGHCNLAQRWPSQRPSQWPSQEPALAQPMAT